jgi:hypothetical protein
MDRNILVALIVAAVAYFLGRDVRTALIMAAVAYGANMLL